MPVQTQMSSFAKKMGARVAQANEEYKEKPVDAGMQRLPGGVKNGVAKLSSLTVSEYKEGDNKGKLYFRASAIAMTPESHDGQKVAGVPTTQMITLDDVPAKAGSMRKAKTFEEGYGEMQNLLRLLGIPACQETRQTDPTGQKAEAYWFAAMKALTAPTRGPVYLNYSTRSWTPPATSAQPKPSPMIFEEWHGLAELNGQHDPAAGVNVHAAQPDQHTAPPQTQTAPQRGAAPPPTSGPPPQYQPEDGNVPDPSDEVAALVEVAMADPNGETEDGAAAGQRLEELAWQSGATKEQTAKAADWAAVGDMALGLLPTSTAPQTQAPPPAQATTEVKVGSRFLFAKRTKDGSKLKNSKGEEFPPMEVEVLTVDAIGKICTLKTIKDNKPVVDIKTKAPVAAKFEWLEVAPPY